MINNDLHILASKLIETDDLLTQLQLKTEECERLKIQLLSLNESAVGIKNLYTNEKDKNIELKELNKNMGLRLSSQNQEIQKLQSNEINSNALRLQSDALNAEQLENNEKNYIQLSKSFLQHCTLLHENNIELPDRKQYEIVIEYLKSKSEMIPKEIPRKCRKRTRKSDKNIVELETMNYNQIDMNDTTTDSVSSVNHNIQYQQQQKQKQQQQQHIDRLIVEKQTFSDKSIMCELMRPMHTVATDTNDLIEYISVNTQCPDMLEKPITQILQECIYDIPYPISDIDDDEFERSISQLDESHENNLSPSTQMISNSNNDDIEHNSMSVYNNINDNGLNHDTIPKTNPKLPVQIPEIDDAQTDQNRLSQSEHIQAENVSCEMVQTNKSSNIKCSMVSINNDNVSQKRTTHLRSFADLVKYKCFPLTPQPSRSVSPQPRRLSRSSSIASNTINTKTKTKAKATITPNAPSSSAINDAKILSEITNSSQLRRISHALCEMFISLIEDKEKNNNNNTPDGATNGIYSNINSILKEVINNNEMLNNQQSNSCSMTTATTTTTTTTTSTTTSTNTTTSDTDTNSISTKTKETTSLITDPSSRYDRIIIEQYKKSTSLPIKNLTEEVLNLPIENSSPSPPSCHSPDDNREYEHQSFTSKRIPDNQSPCNKINQNESMLRRSRRISNRNQYLFNETPVKVTPHRLPSITEETICKSPVNKKLPLIARNPRHCLGRRTIMRKRKRVGDQIINKAYLKEYILTQQRQRQQRQKYMLQQQYHYQQQQQQQEPQQQLNDDDRRLQETDSSDNELHIDEREEWERSNNQEKNINDNDTDTDTDMDMDMASPTVNTNSKRLTDDNETDSDDNQTILNRSLDNLRYSDIESKLQELIQFPTFYPLISPIKNLTDHEIDNNNNNDDDLDDDDDDGDDGDDDNDDDYYYIDGVYLHDDEDDNNNNDNNIDDNDDDVNNNNNNNIDVDGDDKNDDADYDDKNNNNNIDGNDDDKGNDNNDEVGDDDNNDNDNEIGDDFDLNEDVQDDDDDDRDVQDNEQQIDNSKVDNEPLQTDPEKDEQKESTMVKFKHVRQLFSDNSNGLENCKSTEMINIDVNEIECTNTIQDSPLSPSSSPLPPEGKKVIPKPIIIPLQCNTQKNPKHLYSMTQRIIKKYKFYPLLGPQQKIKRKAYDHKKMYHIRICIENYLLDDKWGTEQLNECCTHLMEHFGDDSMQIFLSIYEIIQDCGNVEPINSEQTPPAPAAPLTHQKLIILIKTLSKTIIDFDEFILLRLERKLFTLIVDDLLDLTGAYALMQFYIVLLDAIDDGNGDDDDKGDDVSKKTCRKNKKSKRFKAKIQLLIYKCFYYHYHKSFPMVYVILRAHPNIFGWSSSNPGPVDAADNINDNDNIIHSENTNNKILSETEKFLLKYNKHDLLVLTFKTILSYVKWDNNTKNATNHKVITSSNDTAAGCGDNLILQNPINQHLGLFELYHLLRLKFNFDFKTFTYENLQLILSSKLHSSLTLTRAELKSLSYSYILLAKRKGNEWTETNILNNELVPYIKELLQKNSNLFVNYNCGNSTISEIDRINDSISILIHTISSIVKTFSKIHNVDNYYQLFMSIMELDNIKLNLNAIIDAQTSTAGNNNNNNNTLLLTAAAAATATVQPQSMILKRLKRKQQTIHEAAVAGLLQLSRFGLMNVYQRICSWTPTFRINRKLRLMLKTFIHRKPSKFWKNLN